MWTGDPNLSFNYKITLPLYDGHKHMIKIKANPQFHRQGFFSEFFIIFYTKKSLILMILKMSYGVTN